MELPKHTTQVGTIAANKKLYLEDYCISYMKQQNEAYPGEKKQIALFGTVQRDKNIEYVFAYGAAMLGRGKGRTDSLTNSQKEEAECFRMDFFPDYQLVGIIISADEVNENVYWLGSGNKSVLMDGYYIFYDSNEAMLNFMMQNQKEERAIDLDPVIAKKADMDRERREKAQKARMESAKPAGAERKNKNQAAQKSTAPMAASVLLLTALGIYGIKTNAVDMTQVSSYLNGVWDKAITVTGRYLEEAQENADQSTEQADDMTENGDAQTVQETETQTIQVGMTAEAEAEVQQPAELDVVIIPDPKELENNAASSEAAAETVVMSENVIADMTSQADGSQEYLIKQGDNLLRILRSYYGDESRLSEICDINNIADPDNIQVGQTILLP